MTYSYKDPYTPGEKLVLADAISRVKVCDGSSKPTRSGSDDSDIVLALAEEASISQHREEVQGTLLLRYIVCNWRMGSICNVA